METDLQPASSRFVMYDALTLDTAFSNSAIEYVMQLQTPMDRVTQSFDIDPLTGDFYAAKVGDSNSNNGDDMLLYRCGPNGEMLGWATLAGAGHGGSIAVERDGSDVYIWFTWRTDPIDGSTTGPVRYRWGGVTDGSQVRYLATDVEKLPDMDGMVNDGAQFSIDAANDLLGIRIKDGLKDHLKLRKLSEYKATTDNVLATVELTRSSSSVSWQGFQTIDDYVYVARGGAYPDDGDLPPTLFRHHWYSGEVVQRDTSRVALNPDGTGIGDHNEAEGVSLWRAPDGTASLLFGIAVGELNHRKANVYAISPGLQNGALASRTLRRLDTWTPEWVPIDLAPGISARDGYTPSVCKDPWGFVHCREMHFSNAGLDSQESTILLGTIPEGYRADYEVRWMGFQTVRASTPYGGYVGANYGGINFQVDSTNPRPVPGNHFEIIFQGPWQAAA